ncbi:MAG: hypothetical protein JSU87_01280 [Gemmatimonadota bacterium]|nr:MAG: hypothetical protein JSU87_01280 [Gemmatimonadota bacterium]
MYHRGLPLLALLLMLSQACAERERIGIGPTEPQVSPAVTGTYAATRFLVEREGRVNDLIGEPDTRLDLRLNGDGSARGQLKIGTDPQLRTKSDLLGTWRLSVPNLVTFDFTSPTFLEEVGFQIVHDGLRGEWFGDDVRVVIELKKLD